MANFALAAPNAVEQWSEKYLNEYVRESGLMPYMGTADNSIIRVNMDLAKKSGEYVHFPYFRKLSGAGVTGSTALLGNEEALVNTSTAVRITLRRHGVAIGEDQTFKTHLDIANVARGSLRNRSAELLRDDLLAAMLNPVIKGASVDVEDTVVAYASATEAQKDAYLDNNVDRIVFGTSTSLPSTSAPAGGATYDHSASLGDIASSEKLSAAVLNYARLRIRTATKADGSAGGPKINPYRSDATKGREWYVVFVGPEGFRDLSVDSTIYDANKYARDRGVEDNPIFQSGDLIYNGLIIREEPSIASIGTVGTGSAPISPAYICGASAVALAWGKKPEPRVHVDDYGHQNNVGIVEIRGQQAVSSQGVKVGMGVIYHGVG